MMAKAIQQMRDIRLDPQLEHDCLPLAHEALTFARARR
jgi:hypothetical protein